VVASGLARRAGAPHDDLVVLGLDGCRLGLPAEQLRKPTMNAANATTRIATVFAALATTQADSRLAIPLASGFPDQSYDRRWPRAGAPLGEIDATLLTFKIKI